MKLIYNFFKKRNLSVESRESPTFERYIILIFIIHIREIYNINMKKIDSLKYTLRRIVHDKIKGNKKIASQLTQSS